MSLSEYQLQAATLTHDEGYAFTTKSQWTRYINLSRTACARRTGCIQRLITGQSSWGGGAQPGSIIPGAGVPGALPGSNPTAQQSTTTNSFQTIIGVEKYAFQGFANPYLQKQHAGCKGIIDVASLSVSWGGSLRPAPDWFPWEEFQAYLRAYSVLTLNYPAAWTVFNPGPNGEVYFFPPPSQALEMEWTCFVIPSPIYTDDDYDAIPDGMQSGIQFGAAAYAYLAKEKYAQAQMMEGLFAEHMGVATVAFDRGKVPSWYVSAFS